MKFSHGLARFTVGAAFAISALGCQAATENASDDDPPSAAGSGGRTAGRSGGRGGAAGNGGGAGAPAQLVPEAVTLRVLTDRQLRRSLADLLGPAASVPADLSLVESVGGLAAVSASRFAVPSTSVERIHAAALTLAEQMTASPANRASLVPCTPATPTDEGCLRSFVTTFGRRAYRRPLEAAQLDRLMGVARAVWAVEADFWRGVTGVTAAMLSSPFFLYRAELGRAANGSRTFDDWDLAARLSFFLWDTTPDAELLDRAAAGRLADDATLSQQVDRLLASSRAREALGALFGESFGLDALNGVTRATDRYPAFTASLRTAMRAETLTLFDDVAFARTADVREIYDSRATFVDDELARFYGLAAPGSATPTRATLPSDGPRAGVLTHASLLTIGAHAMATSPTLRGRFVRENVLCSSVPSPPPGVSTELPQPSGKAVTMRERLAEHRSNPSCAACHALMDPLGLPFEQFDAIGSFRKDEGGRTIDPSGDLDGTAFTDAAALTKLLRQRREPAECLARNAFRSAAGHIEGDAEEPALQALLDRFATDGYRLPAFVRALVKSPLFRNAGEVP